MSQPIIAIPEANRAQLKRVAKLLRPACLLATVQLESLLDEAPDTFTADLKRIQDEYWAEVEKHLDSIAACTNNGPSTIRSVFRPNTNNADLGGVLPGVLERIADGRGTWRD